MQTFSALGGESKVHGCDSSLMQESHHMALKKRGGREHGVRGRGARHEEPMPMTKFRGSFCHCCHLSIQSNNCTKESHQPHVEVGKS